MNTPTVSIVIPAYRQAEFLGEAIDSALGQTYPHVEVIVVDDCSPDDTASVVGRYDDPRLSMVVHAVNRGLAAARNTGFAASHGALVAFLDADDYYHREKIAAHVALFDAEPSVGVTYNSRFCLNHSSPTIREIARAPRTCGLADFVMGFPFAPSDMVIRRHWLESGTLFDESLVHFSEDLDINCQLAMAGCVFGGIERALNYRRYHSARSLKVVERLRAALSVLDKVFADPRCPPDVRALEDRARAAHLLVWAFYAFAQRDTAIGQGFLASALRLNPDYCEGRPAPLIRELLEHCIADEQVDHDECLAGMLAQFPTELSSLVQMRNWASAQGYLKRGLRAALWNRPEAAERHFEAAVGRHAVIDEEFIDDATSRLMDFGCEYGAEAAEEALGRAENALRRTDQAAAGRRLRACYAVNQAFCRDRTGDPGVLGHLWQAVTSRPAYLMNRGVLAVGVRSVMPARSARSTGRA